MIRGWTAAGVAAFLVLNAVMFEITHPFMKEGGSGISTGFFIPWIVVVALVLALSWLTPQGREFDKGFIGALLATAVLSLGFCTAHWADPWNYAALHAYGVPKVLDDPKAKHANQRRLVETMDPQWLPSFDALRPDYVKMMLEGIVNFEIAVTRIETRWKLSQNRGRREQELIAAELEKSADSAERALAALTRKQLAD